MTLGGPGSARLLCLGALVLVWAVPVDPQWRVFRTASSVLAPSYSRDITVPVSELRYPGASRKSPRSSPASIRGEEEQQQQQRSRRQYKSSNSYSKQSTFSLLRQLISETANETRTAFNQIGDILGSQFSDSQPKTTTARTTTTSTTTPSSSDAGEGSTGSPTPSTTTARTTTTEAPYRISRQELFSILQRNSIGIGRLFRREYDSAMQDSKVNLNRFKQEFRMVVAPFLQPATTEASTTTTKSRRR